MPRRKKVPKLEPRKRKISEGNLTKTSKSALRRGKKGHYNNICKDIKDGNREREGKAFVRYPNSEGGSKFKLVC